MVWDLAHYMVRALFNAGHDTVVLDTCAITRAQRDAWKSKGWIRKFKVFNTPADVCAERAIRDGQEYLVPVIARMALQHEPVADDEWEDGLT